MDKNNLCYVCLEKKQSKFIKCNNNHCLKNICDECLEQQVNFQLSEEENGNFIKHDKHMYCANCKKNYDKNIFGLTISNKINKKINSLQSIKMLQTNKLTKISQKNELNNLSDDEIIKLHKIVIQENILNLRCPHCDIVIFDFDGCYSLKCNNCANYFCAWCFIGFTNEDDCHKHILYCESTLNYGNYSCSYDKFVVVQNMNKIKKINSYVDKLNPKYKQLILNSIKDDINNLKIDETIVKFKYYNCVNYIFSFYIINYFYKWLIACILGIIYMCVFFMLHYILITIFNFDIASFTDSFSMFIFKDLIIDDYVMYKTH